MHLFYNHLPHVTPIHDILWHSLTWQTLIKSGVARFKYSCTKTLRTCKSAKQMHVDLISSNSFSDLEVLLSWLHKNSHESHLGTDSITVYMLHSKKNQMKYKNRKISRQLSLYLSIKLIDSISTYKKIKTLIFWWKFILYQ